ncbi:MAG: S8 family serine peptidase [Myxococcales bacterium]
MLAAFLVAAACLNFRVATVQPAIRAEMDESGLRTSIRIDVPEGLPRDVPVIRSRNRRAALKLRPGPIAGPGSATRPMPYLLDLRDQLDFERAAALLAGTSMSRQAQRAWMIDALAGIAARSQKRLQPLLDELQRKGEISSFTQISIVNRLVVVGRPSAIRTLSESAEVDSIARRVEAEGSLFDDAAAQSNVDPVPSGWALDALGAPQTWRTGIDGSGVTVGLIDSGASNLHEQLRGNYRGGPSSWFDPLHESPGPNDVQTGHGTAILSCAVGQGRNDVTFGAAPGARWVAAVGLNGSRYDNVLVTRAADWMLNVAQPDVLVLAFRAPGTGCDDSLRRIVNAFRAAEIVVIFAAGNAGPDPRTDVSPANYSQLFPGSGSALSVGGVDSARKGDPRSSRGPSRCGGVLFPQIVAPGTDVPVAAAAGTSLYRRATGTSFAAGYVAGAAALLLQQFPHARVGQIEEALRRSAIDLGPPGPDSTYGYGLISVPAAMEYLRSRVLSQ